MEGVNLVGKTLANRYEVLELIGSGGMATVYKAHCKMLDRDVAIKVLRNSLKNDENVVKNFYKESQAAASLSHNNIVSVYDVGEEDGLSFIIMEYVDGITLKEYIKKNERLPWQQACDFTIQICQALEQAHAKNIIHRDIKPQNILLTNDKTCKVTDFGIAKAVASETVVVGGNTLGSVHYISPEQARGGFTDARSDIYSLGVVLYEMLTGHVPFDGETAVAIALQHLEKDPEPIKCVSLDIPTDLSYVAMKAMSKEQRNRYQTAEEMASDVRAVLAGEVLPSKENAEEQNDETAQTRIINVNEIKKAHAETVKEQENTQSEEETADAVHQNEPEEYDEYDDEYEDEKRSKKKKKNKKTKKQKTPQQRKEDKLAVILALLTIVVFAGAIFGGYYYFNRSNSVRVPDIVNQTLEEAEVTLNGTEFRLSDKIEYAISDTVEDGRIISQDPEAHTDVPSGEEIRVVVSIGSIGGDIETPSVEGMTGEDAIEAIIERNLNYEIIEEHSDSVREGYVIRQSPEAGTMLNEDESVKIYLSLGRQEATDPPVVRRNVPNIVGGSQERAIELIQNAGLSVGSIKTEESDREPGTVISQSPESGRQISEGGTVSFVIAAPRTSATSEPTQSPSSNEDDEPTSRPEATSRPESGSDDDDNETSNTDNNNNSSGMVTKTFTAYLPQDGNESMNVRITVDGNPVYNRIHSRDDEAVSIDITESGTKTIEVYIDGTLTSSREVTF